MTTSQDNFGVLLLNMGGPNNLDEVQEYIYNLLADPLMIRIPMGAILQKPLARFIARKRAPKVRKRYELIGGRSPIDEATSRQAELLSTSLDLPVGYAMRYTQPRADTAVLSLQSRGVRRLIVLPLYPQYSTVSTLSSINDFIELNAGRLDYRIIDRHYNNPLYIRAMAQALNNAITEVDLSLKTSVLFAAHSIPESYIRSGDPYADEVGKTARSICDELKLELPHSLAYQSRVGPVKWRGPTLDEELEVIAGKGFEQLIVQPLSFVSENLETLFDLDIEFKESCEKAGIKQMHRIPTPGTSQPYIDALSDIVMKAISEWRKADA